MSLKWVQRARENERQTIGLKQKEGPSKTDSEDAEIMPGCSEVHRSNGIVERIQAISSAILKMSTSTTLGGATVPE